MSEYTAPSLVNNYITAKILTNVSPGSIMLQVQNTSADEAVTSSVVQLQNNQSVLYNTVVTSTPNSLNYNEDLINGYINSGVLSTSVLTPKAPIGNIKGVLGSNHVISISNAQLTKQPTANQINALELFYSVTVNNIGNTLNILVYRGTKGFYYSINTGSSIIPIPTSGMLYPSQVTSIAIQSVVSSTTSGNIKIWAGTLQEGLLSYTIGDSSWISETNSEQLSGQYIFRNTLIYKLYNYSNVLQSTTTTTEGYSPIYILGILNNPIDAGLPILVYSKPVTTTVIATLDVTNTVVASSTTAYVKTIFNVYKYTSSNYYSYILNTTYGIYNKQPFTTDSSAPGYTWTTFSNPITDEICDVLKSIPYLTAYGITNTSQTITAVSAYSTSLSKYIVELLYLSVSNDINNGTSTRQLTINKDTNIGSTTIINPNQFTGLSYFNTDIFITTRNNIFRYTNNAWATWLTASDTSTSERNLCINSDFVFTLTSPASYLSGLRGFGIIQSSTANISFGILNTDYGDVVFTLTKTITDNITPIVNSKTMRLDIFGTSVRDLQVVPELNLAFSCGLVIEPLNRYLLPTTTFGDPLKFINYIPYITTSMPSTISYTYSQIFYKNYTLTNSTLPYLINRFDYVNEVYVNTDQLYVNVTNTPNVAVLKSLPSSIIYVDTTNNYSWLDSVTSTYVSNCIKYNRLKFLLQTSQNIPLVEATLSSNLEIPFIPDIDFQFPVPSGSSEIGTISLSVSDTGFDPDLFSGNIIYIPDNSGDQNSLGGPLSASIRVVANVPVTWTWEVLNGAYSASAYGGGGGPFTEQSVTIVDNGSTNEIAEVLAEFPWGGYGQTVTITSTATDINSVQESETIDVTIVATPIIMSADNTQTFSFVGDQLYDDNDSPVNDNQISMNVLLFRRTGMTDPITITVPFQLIGNDAGDVNGVPMSEVGPTIITDAPDSFTINYQPLTAEAFQNFTGPINASVTLSTQSVSNEPFNFSTFFVGTGWQLSS